jgi:prepilin-type N-terminal cleavage/methylation domain-containing protein
MKKRAFTLVEMLIVVVIIGILATFVVLALSSATKKTRDARAKRSVETVRDAIEQYITAKDDSAALNSATHFGAATITVTKDSTFNTTIKNGGGTGFSSDPNDANGDPIKVRFVANGYFAEAKASSGYCWKVTRSSSDEVTDNLSDKTLDSSDACTLY